MRRQFAAVVSAVAIVTACSAVLTGAGVAAAGTHSAGATSGGTWSTAEEVPGTGALNTADNAQVLSVSCGSGSNCTAGGFYEDSSGMQAFVANEVNGTWRTAKEVPGTAALNQAGSARVSSVSCASAGNCAAGGWYEDGSRRGQAFVANEVNGSWGSAIEVPGTATFNTGGSAQVTSVSCAPAGNCSAGGQYSTGPCCNSYQVFVVEETNGTWGTAMEIPGTAALNTTGNAQVTSVSCASAGNCSVGGWYQDGSSRRQAFVAGETNGVWGKAKQVPGTAVLNAGGGAQVTSVSCGSAGNCSAGGEYTDGSGHTQAFLVGETSGTWGRAKEVPGTAVLNAGGSAQVTSVSCTSVGYCSVGGAYLDGSVQFQAFVVGETNSVWGKAKQVPGTAALSAGGGAWVTSVSCASAGNCNGGGYYEDGSGNTQAFVVGETNGSWGKAKQVPGTGALNAGGAAEIHSVSCASAGHCSAGGAYTDSSFNTQAFVASKT